MEVPISDSLSHHRFYHPNDDLDGSPFSLRCRLEFYLEALPGQEGKSEREKECRVVGSTEEAKQQLSHYFLEFDTDDDIKIGRFIRTVLEAAK